MPQVDLLDYLLSSAPSLERHVILVFQQGSAFMKSRVIESVLSIFHSGEWLVLSKPLDSRMLDTTLFVGSILDFIDLSSFNSEMGRHKSVTEAAVVRYLDKIVGGTPEDAGSLLIVPAQHHSPLSGPVWHKAHWPCWPSITKSATVIVEPRVSPDNAGEIIEKLLKLSKLSNGLSASNKESIIAYLIGYVQKEKTTLFQLSHQVDTAVLTGIDRASGRFDAQALGDDGAELGDVPPIGASLRSFLDNPESSRLNVAVSSLDDRLNNRSSTVVAALRQLYRGSTAHLKAQDHADSRAALWAWLLLACDLPTSKAALIEVYLAMLIRYRSLYRSGQIGTEKDLRLDAVLNAQAAGRKEQASGLDRAKGELADVLAERVYGQPLATAPDWMSKLKLVSEFQHSIERSEGDTEHREKTKSDEDDDESNAAWEQEQSDGNEACDDVGPHGALSQSQGQQHLNRPKSFDDLSGQNPIRNALRARMTADRTQDHVIFHGADGVGKKAIATLYGQAMVCSGPIASEKPCGCCSGCESFEDQGWNGRWHDLDRMLTRRIDECVADREGASLSSSERATMESQAQTAFKHDVLSLIDTIKLGGLGALTNDRQRMVMLIDNIDTMEESLADRFLHALELVGGPTSSIFVASDLRKVRPALRSRCQAYRITSLDRHRSMELLARACGQLGIVPEVATLDLIAAHASHRAGAMLSLLTNVYRFGWGDVKQLRVALNLNWVEHIHDVLSTMSTGEQEQVLDAFGRLGTTPWESLSRLRITMQALDTVEHVSQCDCNAVLPAAFMHTGEHLIRSLRALMVEMAAQVGMRPADYRLWLMSRLNSIVAVESASILTEIVWLSRAMLGGAARIKS